MIASDKTGTLTQNKMYVTNTSAGLKTISSVMARRASVQIDPDYKIKSTLQLLCICMLCNESKFDEADMKKPIHERKMTGGATDCAILKYAATHIEIDHVNTDFKVISQVPFNSKNKWMAVIFKENENIIYNESDPFERLNCFGLDKNECVISIKGFIFNFNIYLKNNYQMN